MYIQNVSCLRNIVSARQKNDVPILFSGQSATDSVRIVPFPRKLHQVGNETIVVTSAKHDLTPDTIHQINHLHSVCLAEKHNWKTKDGLNAFPPGWVKDLFVRWRSRKAIEFRREALRTNQWQIARVLPKYKGMEMPVIGFTEVENREGKEAYLVSLYVNKEYRGKNKALAYFLMRGVLTEAIKDRKKRLWLVVPPINTRAVQFYENLGFQKKSIKDKNIYGQEVPFYEMAVEGIEAMMAICKRCTGILSRPEFSLGPSTRDKTEHSAIRPI